VSASTTHLPEKSFSQLRGVGDWIFYYFGSQFLNLHMGLLIGMATNLKNWPMGEVVPK
jgi:hypothetical protein